MSAQKKLAKRTVRRALRTRAAMRKSSTLPRVSVFRSLNHIYAQIIDDRTKKTMVSFSSLQVETREGDKKMVAHAIGIELARRAKEHGIESAIFDRGSFLYHGRVKALAEGLREGGLNI